MLASANPLATFRETSRPAASGDKRCWSFRQSPFLHQGQELWFAFPGGHRGRDQHHPSLRSTVYAPCYWILSTGCYQSSIATFRTRLLTLNRGLRHPFQWIFIVADVPHAILGADFLHHFGLSVDIRKLLFTNTQTQLQVNGMLTTSISVRPSIPLLHRIHTLLSSWSSLTSFALAVLPSLPSIPSPTTYAPLDLRFQLTLTICLWIVFA